MKIVYVSNSGQPGGVEQHVLDLVRGMVAKGHQVYVVCPTGPMAEAYYDAGAKIKFDVPALDIDPLYIFRLVLFLREIEPDIFHAHQLKTVVNGLIAAKLAGCPAKVVHIHTPLSEWPIPDWKKRIDIFINREVTNRWADAVLALTKATERERIRGEEIRPEKIAVIPNGLEIAEFRIENQELRGKEFRRKLEIPENTVLIGMLGRLTIEKGHRFLIEALPLLSSQFSIHNSRFLVVIAGDGELRPQLETRAIGLGVADRVKFLGFIPEAEKVDFLSALDIFAFPSLAEGFGIALIEAMAAGCCCLAADLPVLTEVGGKAIATFRKGDSEDLADKISQLITYSGRRDALREQARERVEREFSLEKFWERYETLYQHLIASRSVKKDKR